MVEFSLTHDGTSWVAWNESWTVRGTTLQNLDRALAGIVPDLPVVVRMTFDRSAFPAWIRQYSQHYFNRVVTIDRRS